MERLNDKEQEYIDKLLNIFRSKSNDTIESIMRTIDVLLEVPCSNKSRRMIKEGQGKLISPLEAKEEVKGVGKIIPFRRDMIK